MAISSKGSPDVDNNPQAYRAKVALRQLVFQAPPIPRVFDAFAGSGAMYSAVWRKAQTYAGCDLKTQLDARLMFCADNRRVMRAIDLTKFNIFDFDAYGSPWEQCVILADRRPVKPDEVIGLVLTEGAGLSYRNNIVPTAVAVLTGLRHGKIVAMSKKQDAIIDRSIAGLAKAMNCAVEKRWQASGTTGAAMRYIGLVLRGL